MEGEVWVRGAPWGPYCTLGAPRSPLEVVHPTDISVGRPVRERWSCLGVVWGSCEGTLTLPAGKLEKEGL